MIRWCCSGWHINMEPTKHFPRLQAFQADQTAWTLQPMLGFVRSLRSVAEAADAGLAKTGKRPEKLADCLDKLRKLFQAAQQASGTANISVLNSPEVTTLNVADDAGVAVKSAGVPPGSGGRQHTAITPMHVRHSPHSHPNSFRHSSPSSTPVDVSNAPLRCCMQQGQEAGDAGPNRCG